MTHVVTQACCADASCVFACPVNCIHPSPDDPDFLLAEMLYIDGESCVDCGACVSACPVGAIVPDTKLTPDQLPFVDINTIFYREPKAYPIQAPVPPVTGLNPALDTLRVAIVGSGPAALYAADELLKQDNVEVNVFDRLPTPHGLVRAGVAPDHLETKSIQKLFRQIENQRGFNYHLGVEVGRDITHAELLSHHHAVIYATGASRDRAMDIDGEDLPGSVTATDFVAWYNGHPDFTDLEFDLDHEKAVIVGNGNVALDVARILTTDPDRLAPTDIADHALEALRSSRIRDVVIVARRGVAQAAYTLPELTGLMSRDDIDFVVNPAELVLDEESARQRATGDLDGTVERKITDMERIAEREPNGSDRRITFRYLVSPQKVTGDDAVTGVDLVRNELRTIDGVVRAVSTDLHEHLEAGLVLRSIGYRGVPVPDVPFDEAKSVIPNTEGRVNEAGSTYVAGWIKRGPSGFIGTNKSCSQETVNTLIDDFNAGALATPSRSAEELIALAKRLGAIDLSGWRHIDAAERARGRTAGRTRVKFTRVADMRAAR